MDHLARLDEQLGRPKWVVPVRPDDDLERLLKASIKLCKQGAHVLSFLVLPHFLRFFLIPPQHTLLFALTTAHFLLLLLPPLSLSPLFIPPPFFLFSLFLLSSFSLPSSFLPSLFLRSSFFALCSSSVLIFCFSLSSLFLLLSPFLSLFLLPPLFCSPLSFPLVGRDIECEPCQRFFREGLTTSFMRILTDDAVSTWKPDIQVSGYSDLCTHCVSCSLWPSPIAS